MPVVSNNNKRIAKNTLFLYIRMFFVLVVSIYTTRVVLKTLGVEDFGIYNVVCGFVSMFAFFNTTMSNGIQRFYNYEAGRGAEADVTKVFRTAVLIQVSIAIVILFLLEVIGIWYINNKMVIPEERLFAANWVFQFSALSLILLILQIPYSAAIIAHEHMDYYAVVSMLDVVLKLVIVLILPFFPGDKLVFYGTLSLFVSGLNFLANYIYAKLRFTELKFKFVFYKYQFKSILSFTGWNLIEMFAWMTQGQGVNMVINLFFGPVINAARGIAMQVQNAVQSFCTNLVTAFRPQIIQSYAQEEYVRTKKMMYSLSKIMFLFYFLISMPLVMEMDFVLNLWLDGEVPNYTTAFATLMIVSMYPRNFVAAFSQVIHASGIMKKYQLWSAAIIAGVLPFSYITLKMGYPPTSVYWVNLVFCVILFIVCLKLLQGIFPFSTSEYMKEVILPCILVATMVVVVLFVAKNFFHEGWLRLLLICILSTIATLAGSYCLALNKQEKSMIQSMILRKIKKN